MKFKLLLILFLFILLSVPSHAQEMCHSCEDSDCFETCVICPDDCNICTDKLITLPIVGEINIEKISLTWMTIIIGLLDGLNPCSMWVLLLLLTLAVYTKSRKKMFLIGGLFILVSGIGYFIFMITWLNLLALVDFFSVMNVIIGIFAVIIGLINLKEPFSKKGPSLSIPEKSKPKLFEKMRKIVNEKRIPMIILGIIVLALTVNFVELLCTAGFPAIYTGILNLSNLTTIQHYLYILLYIAMYELDDLIVLGFAMWTFGSLKLTKKQGKWMKFAAGVMMFILGLLLIFKPELLVFG